MLIHAFFKWWKYLCCVCRVFVESVDAKLQSIPPVPSVRIFRVIQKERLPVRPVAHRFPERRIQQHAHVRHSNRGVRIRTIRA